MRARNIADDDGGGEGDLRRSRWTSRAILELKSTSTRWWNLNASFRRSRGGARWRPEGKLRGPAAPGAGPALEGPIDNELMAVNLTNQVQRTHGRGVVEGRMKRMVVPEAKGDRGAADINQRHDRHVASLPTSDQRGARGGHRGKPAARPRCAAGLWRDLTDNVNQPRRTSLRRCARSRKR
jgi:hypothetical protein